MWCGEVLVCGIGVGVGVMWMWALVLAGVGEDVVVAVFLGLLVLVLCVFGISRLGFYSTTSLPASSYFVAYRPTALSCDWPHYFTTRIYFRVFHHDVYDPTRYDTARG